MMDTTIEKQLRRDKVGLVMRNALLEKKAQENETTVRALENSEKRYRRLFESAKDGILILDAHTGKVVDVNPFTLSLLGYTYAAVCGKHLWEIGAFHDIAASKEAFKSLQENQYIRYENLPLVTVDGRHIAVEFVSNVYLVDDQKVIQCNIRDITENKRAQRALEESESKTKSILDNINIGVVLISPQMEIIELNRRMREWFPEIDVGQRPTCYSVFSDLPLTGVCDNCPAVKTLQDGSVHEETLQRTLAGKERSYRVVSSPIRNASGEVTAVIEMIEDITQRLSLESRFQQAQKLESVGQLAGGVAHDYNNMLSVIHGYAELALDKVDRSDPVHEDLQEILKAARRSTAVTRQLLAFARKQTILPKLIDLNDTIEQMLKMLRHLIGENIDLAWLPATGLGPILMDPTQLDQLLANLCVNARDAIADVGKITIETKRVAFEKAFCDDHADFLPGDYVLLSVTDDGCGMDKETQKNLFEPFFTTKRVGKGTGLGLSTVYGIVKQNHGFINVYSEPGQGTTFKIYLKSQMGPTVNPREERTEGIFTGPGELILVVEDEPGVLHLVRAMLEKVGYTVLTASTPDEAIRSAEAHTGKIRLLITDVIMPDMNGRELAERLISLEPGLNCLFMSGYTSTVITRMGVSDQGVQFIQKPFSLKHLAAKVRKAMGKE